MGALSNYFSAKVMNVLMAGQSLTAGGQTLAWGSAPALYIGLTTTASTASAPGAEVSGGSYARQSVVCSTANWSGSNGSLSNANAISFSNMPACTLVGFGIYDALTGGNQLWYGTLTGQPIPVASGATVIFAAGQLSLSDN